MDLLTLIIVLAAVGVVLWALNKWGSAFIDGNVLRIINIVALVVIVLWVLSLFGILDIVRSVHVGNHVR